MKLLGVLLIPLDGVLVHWRLLWPFLGVCHSWVPYPFFTQQSLPLLQTKLDTCNRIRLSSPFIFCQIGPLLVCSQICQFSLTLFRAWLTKDWGLQVQMHEVSLVFHANSCALASALSYNYKNKEDTAVDKLAHCLLQ